MNKFIPIFLVCLALVFPISASAADTYKNQQQTNQTQQSTKSQQDAEENHKASNSNGEGVDSKSPTDDHDSIVPPGNGW